MVKIFWVHRWWLSTPRDVTVVMTEVMEIDMVGVVHEVVSVEDAVTWLVMNVVNGDILPESAVIDVDLVAMTCDAMTETDVTDAEVIRVQDQDHREDAHFRQESVVTHQDAVQFRPAGLHRQEEETRPLSVHLRTSRA